MVWTPDFVGYPSHGGRSRSTDRELAQVEVDTESTVEGCKANQNELKGFLGDPVTRNCQLVVSDTERPQPAVNHSP